MASTAVTFAGRNNYGQEFGINYGPIHITPERPETPPSPLSTVPFPRDPDFVSRDILFDRIHSTISVPGSRVALVGLGGVGKSQLAIECAYRIRSEWPATWVFWIHASNEARFEQSFRDIADRVKIPGRQDPKVNTYKLVENWLRDENNKWICIIDNADDDKLISLPRTTGNEASTNEPPNTSTKPLLEYIPRSLEELEFMPLAIVQAASYIRKRAPLTSVPQYLRDFRRNDREATNLLRKEATGHLNRDWEAKNSILTTWQLSFEHIRHEKPAAADLLSLMSFFDRQGIPESLIRRQTKTHCSSSACEFDKSPDFEDAIITLRDYSFISISETNVFTIHRLVQLTTRMWLESHGQLDIWKEKFIHNLWEDFPNGQYENWERCRSLFAHVKSAMSQKPSSVESQRKWATLLYRGVWYALKSSKLVDALEMASASSIQRVILLGNEHAEAPESTSLLAEVYSLQGRWREVEQLLLQVVETRKTTLSEDHPDTLTSLADLASTYNYQGRWAEAEQIQVQVVQARKIKLGEDHPDTLTTKQLQVQVLQARKIKLGEDHPDTLYIMVHLALTYRRQGQWKEAEDRFIQVMEISKAKLSSKDHPDMLNIMAHLALTYNDQGRWEEAEQLLIEVIERSKEKLGDDHPFTLTSKANLASTYSYLGRWKQAELLEVQVMEARKIRLSEDHPDALSSIANLASTYAHQSRWREAEYLFMQLMKTSKAKLGEDHPDTLNIMAHLALMYSDFGRWEEAKRLQVQVKESRVMKLGYYHPDTLGSMADLASTWKLLAHDAEAINLLRECLARQKQTLGLNHPTTLANSVTLSEWEKEATLESESEWEPDEGWETERE
ncbi:hypothetical protein N7493_007675 [Penicillium malachiteum]|uniref:DUF7779 domain-containing protein n=1 Tax=Penicillium malachiteum TaxID=1324776 RepID=A0AAD6HI27_9EURO|nr:hypothetical protein N7493_007675 [Penicillium malachiteum]